MSDSHGVVGAAVVDAGVVDAAAVDSVVAVDLADTSRAVIGRESRFSGLVWDVDTETVDLGDGQVVRRDVIRHTGAVGIIAIDAHDRVLLVGQYRHPVRAMLWEPPAGLMDIAGEDPLLCAHRELLEEAHQVADTWNVLVDLLTSPGGSDECLRIYLARDVSLASGEPIVGHGEERDMPRTWLDLDVAVARVLNGELHNPAACTGILAAFAAKATGWASLRAADASWGHWRTARKGRGSA